MSLAGETENEHLKFIMLIYLCDGRLITDAVKKTKSLFVGDDEAIMKSIRETILKDAYEVYTKKCPAILGVEFSFVE